MILIDDMYKVKMGQLRATRGRVMKMSHMISDTSLHELHDFARRLGLKRSWFQEDHYDISLEVRNVAVKLEGVLEISMKDMACIRALIKWGSWVPGTCPSEARAEWSKHRRSVAIQFSGEKSLVTRNF